MINLSMRQLVALQQLAQTQSFTEAAARMHTTQSNVSLAIQEAESLLGTRLFERSTRRFRMTSAGEEFIPVVERALADLRSGIDNVLARAQLHRGVLAVGAPPLFAATLLSEVLSSYQVAHPHVDLRVEDASTAELHSGLRSRSIEFAVGTFSRREADLKVIPLFDDALVALAHPGLDLPQACAWKELVRHPLVSIVRNSSVGELIDRTVWKATGQAYRPRLEVHHWSSVISLAESLKGACVVPAYAAGLAHGRQLRKIDLLDPSVLRTISVAHLSHCDISPAGQAFLEMLQQHPRQPLR